MSDRPDMPARYPARPTPPAMNVVPDLRPRMGHPLVTLLAASGISVGMAWGMVKWAATAPTRDEFQHLQNDVVQIRLDQAVAKAVGERQASDTADIKTQVGEIRKSQEEQRRRGR